MSSLLVFLLGLAAIAAYAVGRWDGSPLRERRAALRRANISLVGAFPGGGSTGRIIGTVRLVRGATLRSPLSNRLCVAWVLRTYRCTHQPHEKVPIREEFSCTPFFLEDSTGCALITPCGLSPDLEIDHSDMWDGTSYSQQRLEHVARERPWLTASVDGHVVIEESLLESGDVVSASGEGAWEVKEELDQRPPDAFAYRMHASPRALAEQLVIRNADLSEHWSCLR